MFLPPVVLATVERDLWSWYLYAASLLAAITAIVLFLPWALERRRRPEVKIDWALSLNGDPVKFDDWAAEDAPKIIPGQVICVRVAVHNVGDRASEAALTNFVVPDCFDLRNNYNPEAKPAFSGNPTAGLPPEHRVAFLPIKLEPWTPDNTFIYSYQLTYSTSSAPAQPLRTRLLFDVADSRFNRSGQRRLPSLLPPLELGHAQAGKPWPPGSGRIWFRRVRAAPDGRVACSRGNRRDVRDLIVLPPPQALPSPAKNRRGLLDHRGLARLIKRAARGGRQHDRPARHGRSARQPRANRDRNAAQHPIADVADPPHDQASSCRPLGEYRYRPVIIHRDAHNGPNANPNPIHASAGRNHPDTPATSGGNGCPVALGLGGRRRLQAAHRPVGGGADPVAVGGARRDIASLVRPPGVVVRGATVTMVG
jgi:hypothetical protein